MELRFVVASSNASKSSTELKNGPTIGGITLASPGSILLCFEIHYFVRKLIKCESPRSLLICRNCLLLLFRDRPWEFAVPTPESLIPMTMTDSDDDAYVPENPELDSFVEAALQHGQFCCFVLTRSRHVLTRAMF